MNPLQRQAEDEMIAKLRQQAKGNIEIANAAKDNT